MGTHTKTGYLKVFMRVLMRIGYLKVIMRAPMRIGYLESDFGNEH
jgi:alpha-D-ribose 1-methylphosphonate 5-triphosphate synthase subunit PhnL